MKQCRPAWQSGSELQFMGSPRGALHVSSQPQLPLTHCSSMTHPLPLSSIVPTHSAFSHTPL